jgi:hypothetical protein
MTATPSHFWASVRWFGGETRTMRVRLERRESGFAFVRTADISDAGTPLALPESALIEEAR